MLSPISIRLRSRSCYNPVDSVNKSVQKLSVQIHEKLLNPHRCLIYLYSNQRTVTVNNMNTSSSKARLSSATLVALSPDLFEAHSKFTNSDEPIKDLIGLNPYHYYNLLKAKGVYRFQT